MSAAPAAAPASAYPPRPIAWFSLAVLLLAYTIAFVDRTILALLVGPIQRDLGISDTQMGLLHGIAFALFYCSLGIPIARLSDRYSRRWIIGIGMALWSLMTACCGLARGYLQLFLARVGVGVGEAALSPAAYSMIADLFPPARLGRAIGIYSSGVFFGAGLAFIVGGAVVGLVAGAGLWQLPLIGELRPWQSVFLILGIPGILLAGLMALVPEPARRLSARPGGAAAPPSRLWAYMRDNGRAVAGHFLGFALLAVVFNGFVAWAPTQLIRDFGIDGGTAGRWLGAVIFVFGGGGIIAGGLVADALARRGVRDANLLAGAIGGLGLIPGSVLAPVTGSFAAGVAASALFFFFASFPFGAAAAALQLMAPPDLRARLSAVYLLVINLIGIGFGPVMIAALSDHLLGGKSELGLAMAATGAVVTPLGTLLLFSTRPAYRAALAEAR